MLSYKKLNEELKESCRANSELFYHSITNIEEAQAKKLFHIIEENKETDFGRKNSFHTIKSVTDFRSSVPITKYEDYEEYITQVADGKQNVLTRDKVLMLEPTSGSTSPSKFIPYTNSLKQEFQQGIFPWLYDILTKRSKVAEGSFYWSVTPVTHKQEKTRGGIPIGFGDDGAYFTSQQQGLIARLSAVPFDLAQIQDIGEFKKQTLSHLVRNKDLSFISVWNPTFLSLLLRPLNKPSEVWPNLSFISSWADGNAANYIEGIKNLFPNAEIQGKGLITTEAFVSLPLIGYEGSALSVNSHFFEFRDINNKKDVRLSHELEKGREYETILTTIGGFYRYNLEDVVKVIGFKDKCPLVRFVGRNNNISDLFGEKLNEYHVASAIESVLDNYKIKSTFFILAPEGEIDEGISYTLFLESAKSSQKLKEVAETLDGRLQSNYHYKYCRKLGQLGKLRIFSISSDKNKKASDVYLEESQAAGKKIGNVKPAALSSKTGWSGKFSGRFVE